jgi:hypothetical protein
VLAGLGKSEHSYAGLLVRFIEPTLLLRRALAFTVAQPRQCTLYAATSVFLYAQPNAEKGIDRAKLFIVPISVSSTQPNAEE